MMTLIAGVVVHVECEEESEAASHHTIRIKLRIKEKFFENFGIE